MSLEFFEPAEAAAVMKCTEAWLQAGAAEGGRFPLEKWGKGKVVFTSEDIEAIARMLAVAPLPPAEQTPRFMGVRARRFRDL